MKSKSYTSNIWFWYCSDKLCPMWYGLVVFGCWFQNLESANRIWEENYNKVYNESSNKYPTVDISLRRVHRILILNFAAFHIIPLAGQDMINISAIHKIVNSLLEQYQGDKYQFTRISSHFDWQHKWWRSKIKGNLLLGEHGALQNIRTV